MKIYFMKQKSLDSLQKDISDNLKKYQLQEHWIDQYFIDKETPNYYFDTGIEVNDYELILGGPETDFQNAKIVFEAYKNKINPVQASDLRLWAYLAHEQHWDYMCKRWAIDVPDEEDEAEDGKKSPLDKVADRVKTRYFFGSSRGKAFVRQGIARLYWSAYLTYDEYNDNPYEYTEFFFSKQDIFTSITERSYARNKILVLAALKELKKYPELSRGNIRLFLAKINQAGAITVLDFLDKIQAEQLCVKLMNEVRGVSADTTQEDETKNTGDIISFKNNESSENNIEMKYAQSIIVQESVEDGNRIEHKEKGLWVKIELPKHNGLNTDALNNLFSNMSASYKIFWFKAILNSVIENKRKSTYDELINDMVSEAWDIVNKQKYSLGHSDKLEKLTSYIFDNTELSENAQREEILEYMKNAHGVWEYNYKKMISSNVPYRFQAPFLYRFPQNGWEGNSKTVAERLNRHSGLIYYYNKIDDLNSVIEIAEVWFEYFKENQEILKQWYYYHLKDYINRRNKVNT